MSQTSVTLDGDWTLFSMYFTIRCFLFDVRFTVYSTLEQHLKGTLAYQHKKSQTQNFKRALGLQTFKKKKKFKASRESIYFKLICVSFSDKLCTFHHHKLKQHVLGRMTFWLVFIVLSIVIIIIIINKYNFNFVLRLIHGMHDVRKPICSIGQTLERVLVSHPANAVHVLRAV